MKEFFDIFKFYFLNFKILKNLIIIKIILKYIKVNINIIIYIKILHPYFQSFLQFPSFSSKLVLVIF